VGVAVAALLLAAALTIPVASSNALQLALALARHDTRLSRLLACALILRGRLNHEWHFVALSVALGSFLGDQQHCEHCGHSGIWRKPLYAQRGAGGIPRRCGHCHAAASGAVSLKVLLQSKVSDAFREIELIQSAGKGAGKDVRRRHLLGNRSK
jgi:hypothetical protein